MPDSDKGYPLPDGPIDGYPLICVTLKIPDVAQYRQDFLGHIWQLGKWWNWEQSGLPGDTRAKQAAEYWRGLLVDHLKIEECPVCCCGPQPSFTDRLNMITYNNSSTTVYQDVENTWNTGGQTVTSIAPNLDYGTGDPVDIAKLTCSSLRWLLDTILNQGKQMNQQTADENKDMVNVVAAAMAGLSTAGAAAVVVGGGAAAVVGFFGGPAIVLGLALGAVGTKIATLFMGADQSLFNNTEAIDKVACAMINNTNGESMTRALFQGALVPNDFAPGSPEAQLAAMVQPYLDDLTMYLQFMSLSNQLYDVSDFATLPDCGCAEQETIFYDFQTGLHGWVGDFGATRDGGGLMQNMYGNMSFHLAAAPFDVYAILYENNVSCPDTSYLTSHSDYSSDGNVSIPPGINREANLSPIFLEGDPIYFLENNSIGTTLRVKNMTLYGAPV